MKAHLYCFPYYLKRLILAFVFLLSGLTAVQAQNENGADSLAFSPWSVDIAGGINPQAFFVGNIELGLSGLVSYRVKPKIDVALITGIKNNWLRLPLPGSTYSASLKPVYNINWNTLAGVGYVARRKKSVDIFYLVTGANFFTHKERAERQPYLPLTEASSTTWVWNYGFLLRSYRNIDKKKGFVMHYYLPLGHGPFLDSMRRMSLDFGLCIKL